MVACKNLRKNPLRKTRDYLHCVGNHVSKKNLKFKFVNFCLFFSVTYFSDNFLLWRCAHDLKTFNPDL